MNIKTQIFVIVMVLLGMVFLINKIRRNKLELKYSLLWFVLGIAILIFGCFPQLTSYFAHLFGIGQPINLLFFAGFCFSLMIIYSLSSAVSKLSVKLKRMTQEIALLRDEIGRVKKEIDDKKI